MPYSAIGHSILVLAILAHLIAGDRTVGVALGVMALSIAWVLEDREVSLATWAIFWVVIILTALTWGLFFYRVA